MSYPKRKRKATIVTGVSAHERLTLIAEILEAVDQRCAAADGPVTKTRHEISDEELRAIYVATQNVPALREPTPPGEARLSAMLYRSLERISLSIEGCAKIGFQENKPTTNERHAQVWNDLNDAQADAKLKLKHYAQFVSGAPTPPADPPSQLGICPVCKDYSDGRDELESEVQYWRSLSETYTMKIAALESRGSQAPEATTTEMRICELEMLFLHPNQLYTFTVDPNCAKCLDYLNRSNHKEWLAMVPEASIDYEKEGVPVLRAVFTDAKGETIWREEPYAFSRMNGVGETIVHESVWYKVVRVSACEGTMYVNLALEAKTREK